MGELRLGGGYRNRLRRLIRRFHRSVSHRRKKEIWIVLFRLWNGFRNKLWCPLIRRLDRWQHDWWPGCCAVLRMFYKVSLNECRHEEHWSSSALVAEFGRKLIVLARCLVLWTLRHKKCDRRYRRKSLERTHLALLCTE